MGIKGSFMRKVKIRPYNPIFPGDGTYCHHEEELTYEEAEELCGRKLDRRMNYMVIDGKVCHKIEWSSTCTVAMVADVEIVESLYPKHVCTECGFKFDEPLFFSCPNCRCEEYEEYTNATLDKLKEAAENGIEVKEGADV